VAEVNMKRAVEHLRKEGGGDVNRGTKKKIKNEEKNQPAAVPSLTQPCQKKCTKTMDDESKKQRD